MKVHLVVSWLQFTDMFNIVDLINHSIIKYKLYYELVLRCCLEFQSVSWSKTKAPSFTLDKALSVLQSYSYQRVVLDSFKFVAKLGVESCQHADGVTYLARIFYKTPWDYVTEF
jgi:hypothetical protein